MVDEEISFAFPRNAVQTTDHCVHCTFIMAALVPLLHPQQVMDKTSARSAGMGAEDVSRMLAERMGLGPGEEALVARYVSRGQR